MKSNWMSSYFLALIMEKSSGWLNTNTLHVYVKQKSAGIQWTQLKELLKSLTKEIMSLTINKTNKTDLSTPIRVSWKSFKDLFSIEFKKIHLVINEWMLPDGWTTTKVYKIELVNPCSLALWNWPKNITKNTIGVQHTTILNNKSLF